MDPFSASAVFFCSTAANFCEMRLDYENSGSFIRRACSTDGTEFCIYRTSSAAVSLHFCLTLPSFMWFQFVVGSGRRCGFICRFALEICIYICYVIYLECLLMLANSSSLCLHVLFIHSRRLRNCELRKVWGVEKAVILLFICE